MLLPALGPPRCLVHLFRCCIRVVDAVSLASKSDRLSLDHDDSDASPSLPILELANGTHSLPKLEFASGTHELPAPLLVPPTDTQELPAPLLVPLVCEQSVAFVDVPLLTDIRSSSSSPFRLWLIAGTRIGIEGARLGVDHICGDTAKTMSSGNHRMFDMRAVHGLAFIHASAGQYVATTSFIRFSKSSRSMWFGTRNMMGHQRSPPLEVETPF